MTNKPENKFIIYYEPFGYFTGGGWSMLKDEAHKYSQQEARDMVKTMVKVQVLNTKVGLKEPEMLHNYQIIKWEK
jgi:hypothetical protein